MAFAISSTGFESGGDIPRKFTCDGADLSPELSWTETPPGTVSFTLIADDPDAPSGTWTHWVLFDLPAATTSLAEALPGLTSCPAASGKAEMTSAGSDTTVLVRLPASRT